MMTGEDRLRAGLPRVVEVLHDLARELELTNDELLATLAFLSDVPGKTRRARGSSIPA